MSQFRFLEKEWPAVFEAANKTELSVHSDPRTACFHARRALELAVDWMYKHDSALKLPYQDNLSALLHEPTFKTVTGEVVFNKARIIVTLGNRAVHSHRAIPEQDALIATRELFHVCYWLAHTYSRLSKPAENSTFDPNALPKNSTQSAQTLEQLKNLEAELHARDEKLSLLLADKNALDEELKKLRFEIAVAKKENITQPDAHDYSEEETRDYFIDLLLKEAGWQLDQERDREFEVFGMPNKEGKGYVDYVLWGDDGLPLALVEAKRTRRDARVGQQQAKLYANCLEKQFGRRPIIFYSNGYDHWIWDETNYPPRQVQGFYKKDELELLIQRRQTRRRLATAKINERIVERYYQTRAIRRIAEAFERDSDRKALLVMATGSGKTRTAIALCDLLIRCNWAKRVLFLADRVALVSQAVNAFKRHLPDASPVNLVSERDEEGRVFVSTYPTMMGLIDEIQEGQRRFGAGHFDLIIIDEAHRSVFQKYRAIFDYFDSFLVGLTATPKEEIDRNTYTLFDLENKVPTDAYTLEEAVNDGFLVPPKIVVVPLKYQREGIQYDDLSEEDKDQWDALDWNEEGEIPDRVDAQAVNNWFFNKDTVDKVLEHLMTRGQKVAGGDRLGKTIIFAKNQHHAEFITERFNINYPHYKGEFARTITFKTEYVQSLIDNFTIKDKAPHIAVSVDMLDTGIDVPEVLNLVFFKLMRSKTKFWQMIGRGTRLCPDLFEPGKDKKFFFIFDYCQNMEYFSQNIETTDGASGEPLGKKLFSKRLELIHSLDEHNKASSADHVMKILSTPYSDPATETEVRFSISDLLHKEVAAMNLENFVVRPRRRFVEKYVKPESWAVLTNESLAELREEVAGLPSELDSEDEEAKRFDLLVLSIQLVVLRKSAHFNKLRDRVMDIAALLEEKSAIPMVREQMTLIQEVQSEQWWQDVTIPMLERLRRRLRSLIKLVEKDKCKPVYTDFEDEMGPDQVVEFPAIKQSSDFSKFKEKAQAFLRAHQDHVVVIKLRMNQPLTPVDLQQLEQFFVENGVGTNEQVERAKQDSQGLGLFVRRLVGLDRQAAKRIFEHFIKQRSLTANQIEFVDLIINYLTAHGVMEPELLYEAPFTDFSPQGPEGLFGVSEVDELIEILLNVRSTAA